MIRIFSLKDQKTADGDGAGGSSEPRRAKASAAQLRVTKDISDLSDLPKTCRMHYPDMNNLLNFELTIEPDEGFYKRGRFHFTFTINDNYPHDPPKVKCTTSLYHPNIDLEGNVCLNILREDWKPVLTIGSVIYGLQYLFLEPNADDPLNKEAAKVLQTDKRQFEQNVSYAMRGGAINGHKFDECLVK